MQTSIYKPYLTLNQQIGEHGILEPVLRIKLSLPKFFFGNNFDELQYRDFAPLIIQLQKILTAIETATTTKVLTHTPISAIHYSKKHSTH